MKTMFDELETAYNFLQEIVPRVVNLPLGSFTCMYCMILEEYCKSHKLDILENIDLIHKLIVSVNEAEGKYGACNLSPEE